MGYTGPKSAVDGVVEDAKGKLKEAAGAVTGDERMKSEGVAQQAKAGSEREVAKHEAEAEASRAEARMHEAEQKANQK
ncbi:MAG: CsbD family protein [Actinomycetota bacterium]